MGWLTGWTTKIQVDITENGGGTKDDYAIMLDGYYGNHCAFNPDSLTQFLFNPTYRYSGTHDRTYIATTSSVGVTEIEYWDEDDEELATAVELWTGGTGNDHDGCSVIVLQHQTGGLAGENGTILVAWAKYNVGVYSRRSDNAEDITSWGASVTADASGAGNTYCWLAETSDGTIWCFYRGTNNEIYYRTLTLNADPDLDVWSAATNIFDLDDFTYYCAFVNGADIHFALSKATTGSKYEDVYYIKYQGSDSTWRTADGTQKLVGGGLFDLTDADHTPDLVVNSNPAACDTIIWDIKLDSSNEPNIIYLYYTAHAANTHADVYRAVYSSGWSTADTGIDTVAFGTQVLGLQSGATFEEGDCDTIYAAVPDGSHNAQLQKWVNDGGWAKTEDITQSAPGDCIRPIYVRNGAGQFKVLFFYTERYSDYAANYWEGMRHAYPGFSNRLYLRFSENCRTDFGDVRFTQSNGVTLQPVASSGKPWMQQETDSWRAIFWINAGTVPVAGGILTIYAYCGNALETNANDQDIMDAQFYIADHFSTGALDGDKWDLNGGAVSFVSGHLEITGGAGALVDQDNANYPNVSYYRARFRAYGSDTAPGNIIGSWALSTADLSDKAMINYSGINANRVVPSVANETVQSYINIDGIFVSQWHIWDIAWTNGRVIFSTDSGVHFTCHQPIFEKYNITSNVPDEACTLIFYSQGTATGVVYVDWVFASPVTYPEPIVNVSNEEILGGTNRGWTWCK